MSDIDWLSMSMETKFSVRNFIDGKSIDCEGSELITKLSPRDGKRLYSFAKGRVLEVDLAVNNAQEAFEDGRWRKLPVNQRKSVLLRLADLIEANANTLALYESTDVGKPIMSALNGDIPSAAAVFRECAHSMEQLLFPSGSDGTYMAYQQHKPVGVVGAIVGWNFPLCLASTKVAPALAMGNSVVLKPSEISPLSARTLAELAHDAGVPPGVLNVVQGTGEILGDALARHHKVQLLTFTGSTVTGKKIMVAAGESNMKRLILECGGKSPYLVFNDCPHDLDAVASHIVALAFANQGAVCSAATRLLVENHIKGPLVEKVLEHTDKIIPADPLDSKTTFGALVNQAHLDKVLGYIESGKEQGADLIYGGTRELEDTGGYYVRPTIFDNVSPDHRIAKEEIFGPVLSIIGFDTEQEAIKLANSSPFGLAAYTTTQNLCQVQRLGLQLDSGLLVNRASLNSAGGSIALSQEPHKASGFGYEGGLQGLLSYTVSTAVVNKC